MKPRKIIIFEFRNKSLSSWERKKSVILPVHGNTFIFYMTNMTKWRWDNPEMDDETIETVGYQCRSKMNRWMMSTTQFYKYIQNLHEKLQRTALHKWSTKVTVGVTDLFRVSKNTTQFMERVGRASNQNQALRRWNFCALPSRSRHREGRQTLGFDKEVHSHSIYAKWHVSHWENVAISTTTELRESEHLASVSISARKKVG